MSTPFYPIYEERPETIDAGLRRDVEYLKRRPRHPTTGGVYHFVVFPDTTPVIAGDSAFIFHIPADLDGMALGDVEMNVETASSSGIVQVQLHNATDAVDMLSTRIQVDANERHSKDASTAVVINTANATVAHGDRIRVDVDAAGTGALGLDVVLRFYTTAGFTLRGPTGSVGATGPQGDTGPPGVTAWTGDWVTSTAYDEGNAVNNDGVTYVAIQDHTSGASSEPGTGVDWEDYWMALTVLGGTTGLMELVHDETLSSSGTFDVDAIAQDGAHLQIIALLRGTTSAGQVIANIRFNNDSGSNYDRQQLWGLASSPSASESFGQTAGRLAFVPGASATSGQAGAIEATIPHYTGTTFRKTAISKFGDPQGTSTGTHFAALIETTWRDTSAISRIQIFPDADSFAAGSRLTIYKLMV